MIDAEFEVFKKLSTLVDGQFPAFYRDEGKGFIDFVKAYYEWMEEEDQSLYHSRRMVEYQDIDLTPEAFLVHFQKKYLYGIPFDVIANKRLLLKHVLDAYRSKGTIQCFQLLFRLIYNEDVKVYLPGIDLLRMSDGKWKEIRYIESTDNGNLPSLKGKKIIGSNSMTTAIVEQVTYQVMNRQRIAIVYISNILPKGGQFFVGERYISYSDYLTDRVAALSTAPVIYGSLSEVEILEGNQGFKKGELLRIAKRDPLTKEINSSGDGAIVKVSDTQLGRGTIGFSISHGGFGHKVTSNTYSYKNALDTTGSGARFSVATIKNTKAITYNTDIIGPYLDITFDSTFPLPGNPSANSSTPFQDFLSYDTDTFGTVQTLGNTFPGSDYAYPLNAFVKTPIISNVMVGEVSFNASSYVVEGSNTNFTLLANNDLVALQANTSDDTTIEYIVIKEVTNATSITLYQKPNGVSIAGGWRLAPDVVEASYPPYHAYVADYSPLDANIATAIQVGNGVVSATKAVDSGIGYIDGETVKMYRVGALGTPTIANGGEGYANGDLLMFYGGSPAIWAEGYVTTNSSGAIVETTYITPGSLYDFAPTVAVKSVEGNGASITVALAETDTSSLVTGTVKKKSIGMKTGYWSTTDGFLNSDKRVQDSYYWQDYSYRLGAPISHDKYRGILYDTFHISGAELFGTFDIAIVANGAVELEYSANAGIFTGNSSVITYAYANGEVANTDWYLEFSYSVDSTYTVDSNYPTVDSNANNRHYTF